MAVLIERTITDDALGQLFSLKTGIDLTGYSALNIEFEKPDTTTTSVTATDSGDPTDGRIEWTSTSGFFDQTGTWKMIGTATFGTTAKHYTRPVHISVKDKFTV